MRIVALFFASICLTSAALAQVDLEDSHTTASLRGIDSVGPGVAWASGSGGTILRTEDGGYLWQTCSVPGGAEKLDFRGIRGFDAQTALVMSSGSGPLSKVYRTTDGCQHWTLVLDNPDAEGFFDAIVFDPKDKRKGYLLGDPVSGRFAIFSTTDSGQHWGRLEADGLATKSPGIGAFAASNSSLMANLTFATGGPGGPFLYRRQGTGFTADKLPMAGSSASAGIFALARCGETLVAVGGEYTRPDAREGTAAYFDLKTRTWLPAQTFPGGYRSSVACDTGAGICLATGPTGSDLSRDAGRHWAAMPGTASNVKGWNALSLPFVVGANGRIGKLRDGVIH